MNCEDLEDQLSSILLQRRRQILCSSCICKKKICKPNILIYGGTKISHIVPDFWGMSIAFGQYRF